MMNQPVEQPFYLKDNFAPVSEEISESHLKVIGSIPPALNGRLLRNGPNPSKTRSSRTNEPDTVIVPTE